MLLYALLRNTGNTVRLANGALTQDQAVELLQKTRPVPADGIPALKASKDIPDDLLQKIAAENQIDGAELRKLLTNVTAEQQRVKEAVMRRVTEQASFIAAAVGQPKEDISKKEEAAAVEALRNHWWVQLQQGSTWKDLDPSLPDAEPGRPLGVVTETLAPDKYSDLKKELLHTVQIEAVIEVWNEGKVTEVSVLKQELIPADRIGQVIALRHVPVARPEDINLFAEKDVAGRLKATVLDQKAWIPVLTVGSTDVFKYSFNDRGDLGDTTLPGYIQNVLSARELARKLEEGSTILGNQVKGWFGQPKAEEPKRPPPEASVGLQLTAEWIDYEIHAPGQPVRKIRRQIFDLIGPAARSAEKVGTPEMTEAKRLERGLALLGRIDILPLAAQLSSELVTNLMCKGVLANRQALTDQMSGPDTIESSALREKLKDITPPTSLYALALNRMELNGSANGVYLDRLNILSLHRGFRENTKRDLVIFHGFDIVANDIAVAARARANSFFLRLEQGVVDTFAETLLAAGCPPFTSVDNTAELFSASGAQGIDWVAIRDVRGQAWAALQLPDDIRARIEGDLLANYIIVVPTRSVSIEGTARVGWWRVDPMTGHTLGIGDRGWGQTSVEKIFQIGFLYWSWGLLGFALCKMSKNYDAGKPLYKAYDDLSHADHKECLCVGAFVGAGAVAAGAAAEGAALYAQTVFWNLKYRKPLILVAQGIFLAIIGYCGSRII
jgi:hypothetical protein